MMRLVVRILQLHLSEKVCDRNTQLRNITGSYSLTSKNFLTFCDKVDNAFNTILYVITKRRFKVGDSRFKSRGLLLFVC